jgi:small subunit ribosomal protein S6
MFLVDAAKGGEQFPEVIRHIAGVLQRHEADIERIEKWDERNLAYRIQGTEKGIYVLTYIRLDPQKVADVRRAFNLSEEVLRMLILKEPKMEAPQGELYNAEGEQIAAEPEEEPEETESEEEAEDTETDEDEAEVEAAEEE